MHLLGQGRALLPVHQWKVGVGGLGLMGYVVMAGSGIGRVDFPVHWGRDPRSRVDLAVVAGVAWQEYLEIIKSGLEVEINHVCFSGSSFSIYG